MARGFLSGVLWGGVVGVGLSSAASVMAPAPMAPQVSDVAPSVAEAPARVETASNGETGSTKDRTIVTSAVAPQTPAPDLDTVATISADALISPAQPETGVPAALSNPETLMERAVIDSSADTPVIPTPQALAPMAPQAPDVVVIDTETAQPLVVDAVSDETPAVDGQTNAVLPTTTGANNDAQLAEVVEETTQEDVAPTNEQPADTQTAALIPDAEISIQPVAPPARITDAPDTDDAQQIDTTAIAPTGTARPQIGSPAGTIGDRDNGVTIRRPSSSNLGEVDDRSAQEVADDTGNTPVANDARPISRYSQPYEADGDKPLMSIVLIDDGSSPVTGTAGIAALRGFPYPLSFAVDTSLSDAAERMTKYRNEGFEVLAMVDLPDGAQPSDAETAFGVILSQMNQVVAVLEGTKGGLQTSREVADQVTSILLQTGHGLLSQDKGLNTVPKLARKEGVPADPVFRDFDSKGQTAAVIRRFLDQAAFKAGQEGAVVMLGRMRPDTISALLLWGLQDRAGKVTLAPISALLLREE